MSEFVFKPLKREPEAGEFRFVPVDSEGDSDEFTFTPIEPVRPSTLRNVALNNPLTAIGETALNLASTGVAMPVAGLAGLATEAGRAVGLTDKTGADVVHAVGDALTYQPRGEMGQAATQAVMYPFEKLHEAATWAGNKTQDATGSPGAATAVHTFVEGVLPLVAFPAAKAGRAKWQEHAAAREMPKAIAPEVPTPEAAGEYRFTPIEEARNVTQDSIPSRVSDLVTDQKPLQQPELLRMEVERGAGDSGVPALGAELPEVHRGSRAETESGVLASQVGHGEAFRAGERGLDIAEGSALEGAELPLVERGRQAIDGGGRSTPSRIVEADRLQPSRELPGGAESLAGTVEPQQPRGARYALVEADSLKASHDARMNPVADHPYASRNVSRHEQEMAVSGTREPRETDAAFQKRYRAALGVTDADVLVIRRMIAPARLAA